MIMQKSNWFHEHDNEVGVFQCEAPQTTDVNPTENGPESD